jgi:hypothetical protein
MSSLTKPARPQATIKINGKTYTTIDQPVHFQGTKVTLVESADPSRVRMVIKKQSLPPDKVLANIRKFKKTPAWDSIQSQLVECDIFPADDATGVILVTKYYPGGSVGDVLNSGRRFTLAEVADFLDQIKHVLELCHDQRWVLRALTPDHVMMDGERYRIGGLEYFDQIGETQIPYRPSDENKHYGDPKAANFEEYIGESDNFSLGTLLFQMRCDVPRAEILTMPLHIDPAHPVAKVITTARLRVLESRRLAPIYQVNSMRPRYLTKLEPGKDGVIVTAASNAMEWMQKNREAVDRILKEQIHVNVVQYLNVTYDYTGKRLITVREQARTLAEVFRRQELKKLEDWQNLYDQLREGLKWLTDQHFPYFSIGA